MNLLTLLHDRRREKLHDRRREKHLLPIGLQLTNLKVNHEVGLSLAVAGLTAARCRQLGRRN